MYSWGVMAMNPNMYTPLASVRRIQDRHDLCGWYTNEYPPYTSTMGYRQRLSRRIARRSYASVSICILVRSFGGAPNPKSRWNTPSRTRNLDTFQPLDGDADAHLGEDDRARLAGVQQVGEDDRLARERAHCVRTDGNPSRLTFSSRTRRRA